MALPKSTVYLTRRTPEQERFYKFKYRYGITPCQYDKLRKKQGGRCKICGEKVRKLVVDHCHTKGNVRALLCSNCNSALGLLKENVKRFKNAIRYLIEHA